MANQGQEYGSKWNLDQYLKFGNDNLNKAIIDVLGMKALGVKKIEWLFLENGTEFKGIDFISNPSSEIINAWQNYWPQSGNVQNWDAVGRMHRSDRLDDFEYILVEAKGHVNEVRTSCNAKSAESLEMIRQAMLQTKNILGVSSDRDYLNGYYQTANRLAFLCFLHEQNIPVRLVFLYFCGDKHPGKICPKDESAWFSLCLNDEKKHLGLTGDYILSDRIHKVFLPAYNL